MALILNRNKNGKKKVVVIFYKEMYERYLFVATLSLIDRNITYSLLGKFTMYYAIHIYIKYRCNFFPSFFDLGKTSISNVFQTLASNVTAIR